jgi:hypothetical protein
MNSKELRNLALGLALGLLGAGALAGVSLPHTFSAGSPIRAAEVNAKKRRGSWTQEKWSLG